MSNVTSNETTLKARITGRGQAFMARATARPPRRRNGGSNTQAVLLTILGVKSPGRPLRLPPLRMELVDTRRPQKRWLREPNLLRLLRLRKKLTTKRTFACRGRRWRQWIPSAPRQCSTMLPRALGRKMPHQSFNQFQCSCRHPCRSVLEIPAPFRTRVSRSCNLAGLAIRA